jgi:hypothetical protein
MAVRRGKKLVDRRDVSKLVEEGNMISMEIDYYHTLIV